MRYFLHLPHLKIHNANAMSSPFTIGMPAMTAWLGAMHFLQRKLQQEGFAIEFLSLAIANYAFNLQTYKGKGDYVYSIIGTGHPLDEKGERPAFVEEPRCHLEVSLLLEMDNIPLKDKKLLAKIDETIHIMKFAGGDLLSSLPCEIISFDDEQDSQKSMRKIHKALMPGFLLLDRHHLVKQSMSDNNQDSLDALLDYLKVFHTVIRNEKGQVEWTSNCKQAGWFVPIATGFQGISDLHIAENQRDTTTPHRFAESVVTLGEFVMAHRIENIDDMLWHYSAPNPEDSKQNLYLCKTTTN